LVGDQPGQQVDRWGTLHPAALGLGQPGGGVGVQPKLDEPGVAALDAGDQFGLQRGLPGRAGGGGVLGGLHQQRAHPTSPPEAPRRR
jgi:hypothetical protein